MRASGLGRRSGCACPAEGLAHRGHRTFGSPGRVLRDPHQAERVEPVCRHGRLGGATPPSLLPTLARLKRIGKAHSKFGSPNLSLTGAVTRRGAWPKQRCRDR